MTIRITNAGRKDRKEIKEALVPAAMILSMLSFLAAIWVLINI